MQEIPDFWRTEVFHPLSVHFPIALLLVATLFKIVSLWSRNKLWPQAGSILLGLGILGAWIAIYTGNQADGIVSRQLCDPTVLKDHENLAYITAWIFTAGFALDLALTYGMLNFKRNIFKFILVLGMLSGSALLGYAGHLGATLVYQQAAGVYTPSEDCQEFN
ncbi:DUF2231 domain-containing protein [Salegentibacter sediminis]|uniref:DUF2231 domain-containing protein n=1 Tax=Salegentibacter sediminis TaxID=1930251 RepID=UPI0009BD7997|nr:DUF2231 domain-containing protein [Salegentibacter sediminis]